MIIKIESVDIDDVNNLRFSNAIENLLRSFAESKHIIIAPRLFFKTIINDSTGIYSANSKGIATEALRGQTEYQSIINSLSFFVLIDFNIEDVSYEWITSGNTDKLRCGPLFFNDSSQLQKIRIVCENPLDSDFLKIIAFHYAKSENLSRCTIEYNALNGGGGSTKDIFDRTVQNNEITFCIVDNDKQHPRAPFGGTSSHFLGNVINKSGMVKILEAHEIESLLPIDTIEEVLEHLNLMQKKGDAFRFFRRLCEIDESVKFYYDHKKGFDLSAAWKLDRTHGEYWRDIIKKLNIAHHCSCIEKSDCNCNPSCLSYEGFGDGLLNNSLKHIARGSLRQFTPVLTPKMSEIWRDVGKNFFSWSCGPYKKVRVS